MKNSVLLLLTALASASFAKPLSTKPVKIQPQVPATLEGVRPIHPAAVKTKHILISNVAGAVPAADWSLAVTYAVSRLQLNVWTNALPSCPAGLEKGASFGENAAFGVFVEDAGDALPFLAAPGRWCRVNVHGLKADNPSPQILRDRYAKAVLKGLSMACGGGFSLDSHSANACKSSTLAGLDEVAVTLTPDTYFPMLEAIRAFGGDEVLCPAHDE